MEQSGSFAERPKLGQEVTRVLREEILTRELEEGRRLAIGEIADRLGVSSMPVREALTALASEGLVVTLPRRGFRVARVEERDISDAFAVHAYVAGMLARRACGRLSPDELDELRRLQGEIVATASSPTLSEEQRIVQVEGLNFLFHRLINERADGARLRWFLRASLRFIPSRYYVTTPGWVETSLSDHPGIIEALESGDAVRAEGEMSAHVLHGGELVVRRMRATVDEAVAVGHSTDVD